MRILQPKKKSDPIPQPLWQLTMTVILKYIVAAYLQYRNIIMAQFNMW